MNKGHRRPAGGSSSVCWWAKPPAARTAACSAHLTSAPRGQPGTSPWGDMAAISTSLSSSSEALIRVTEGIFLPGAWDDPFLKLSGWAGETLAEMLLDANTASQEGPQMSPGTKTSASQGWACGWESSHYGTLASLYSRAGGREERSKSNLFCWEGQTFTPRS